MKRMAAAAFAVGLSAMATPSLAGNTIVSLPFGGAQRSSLLHVPANYDDRAAYPLVLVFHGSDGTGAEMEKITRMDALADQYGFFVAYPDSVGSQWVLSGTNNDVQFTVALMQAIEASYHLDPTRVYSAGYSQGAAVAEQAQLCNPTLISGVGDISQDLNSAWQSVCKLTVPVTFVNFHGTADPISPYNGNGKGVYSAMQTTATWAQASGCPNASSPKSATYPDTLNSGANVTDTSYAWSGCGGGATAAFYSITGGGHTWPGGTQRNTPSLGPVSEKTNASLILWQAFSPHHSTAAFPGACGPAVGVSTAVAPSVGLCRTGIASAVVGGSTWTWTCSGYNGGRSAQCSAPLDSDADRHWWSRDAVTQR